MPSWFGDSLAVLSLVLAGLAFWRSWHASRSALRSALAAEETAFLDRAQWLQAREPQFKVGHKMIGSRSEVSVIYIEKVGGEDPVHVEATVEEAAGYPVPFIPHSINPVGIGGFKDGDRYHIRGTKPDQNGGRVVVKLVCRRTPDSEETWTVRKELDFAQAPWVV